MTKKSNLFPDVGLVHVQDNETGEIRLIDTSSKKLRQQYAQYYRDLDQRYQSIFKKIIQAQSVFVPTKIMFAHC